MALSDPRAIFGVHSVTPYNRSTGEFYGTIKVLQSSSLSLSGELINLTGGSSKYPWAVEDGLITSELSLSFSQYDDFLYELFMGKAATSNSAESGGSVTTLTDKYGTVVNATTGIASVGVKSGSEADLKFGRFVVKVVSATTVDVYAASDADFARGTDLVFVNDLLKITSSPLTIPDTGAAVEIPNTGLELIGGSGTVNLETAGAVGDTATFESRPINTGSMDITIGASTDSFPEWGAILLAQKRSGELVEIDVFRAKLAGMPIGLNANEFSTVEATAQCFYDSTRNGVFSMRAVNV